MVFSVTLLVFLVVLGLALGGFGGFGGIRVRFAATLMWSGRRVLVIWHSILRFGLVFIGLIAGDKLAAGGIATGLLWVLRLFICVGSALTFCVCLIVVWFFLFCYCCLFWVLILGLRFI